MAEGEFIHEPFHCLAHRRKPEDDRDILVRGPIQRPGETRQRQDTAIYDGFRGAFERARRGWLPDLQPPNLPARWVSTCFREIASISLEIFSADGSGSGLAAAEIVRDHQNQLTTTVITKTPIAFDGDNLYLGFSGPATHSCLFEISGSADAILTVLVQTVLG